MLSAPIPDSPSPQAPPRIVVGVDGSPESELALRWAARLAPSLGARIEVIAAWQIPAAYGWALVETLKVDVADIEKLATQTIDAVFGSERPNGLSLIVREGHPATILIKASQTALMTIVGSRGRGGFVDMLVGSVSAAVMEHATCPVLVVHGNSGELQPAADRTI
jgi:nucleotide-binding universal stress UspA family protein